MAVILINTGTRDNKEIVLKVCPLHFQKVLAIRNVVDNLVKQEATLESSMVNPAWDVDYGGRGHFLNSTGDMKPSVMQQKVKKR